MTISEEIINLVKLKLVSGQCKVNIAKDLNVSVRTVQSVANGQRTLRHSTKTGKCQKTLDMSVKRAMRTINKEKSRVSIKKVGQLLQNKTSPSTILRRLHSMGYKYRSVADKVVLTAKQKERRVEAIKAWICGKVDLDKVIFSDECKFTLDGNDGSMTWVKKITHRRQKRPFRGGSIMVWGCMSRDGLLVLKKLEGTLTSTKYCDLLEKDVLPILKDKYDEYRFQQDNARPHCSKIAKQFFETNDVILLDWPPYSPDLSPIEKIWSIMKEKVYNGPQFSSKEVLWTKIQEIWENIHLEYPSLFLDLYSKLYRDICEILCTNGNVINK